MLNIMIAVLLAAAPAAAQEFAAEMPAMGEIVARTRALKTAAALPAPTYDPREIRVEAVLARGTDDFEPPGKAIRIYHKELPLATLHVGGKLVGRRVLHRLAGYLEASRLRAIELGRKVSLDDKAVALYNGTGFLNRMPLEEPERFGAILRITDEPALPAR